MGYMPLSCISIYTIPFLAQVALIVPSSLAFQGYNLAFQKKKEKARMLHSRLFSESMTVNLWFTTHSAIIFPI